MGQTGRRKTKGESHRGRVESPKKKQKAHQKKRNEWNTWADIIKQGRNFTSCLFFFRFKAPFRLLFDTFRWEEKAEMLYANTDKLLIIETCALRTKMLEIVGMQMSRCNVAVATTVHPNGEKQKQDHLLFFETQKHFCVLGSSGQTLERIMR